MSTPATQLDRVTVSEQVQDVVRQLLAELGSPAVSRVLAGAHLERDRTVPCFETTDDDLAEQ